MVKFFRTFQHDGQHNVIKRTPPPRLMQIFKNVLLPPKNKATVFGFDPGHDVQDHDDPLASNTDHSSLLRRFQLACQTIKNQNIKGPGHCMPSLKDDLSIKKIDPAIVASALASPPEVHKKVLINIINHMNFTNEKVSIHIKDKTTFDEFFLQGEPCPYTGDKVEINFSDPEGFDIERHIPLNLVIDNRKSLIVMPIDPQYTKPQSVSLSLPDKAHSYSKRQAVRHPCGGIDAEIVQGLLHTKGFLEDINPQDLRVGLSSAPDFNPANPLFLKLSREDEIYFIGECRILRRGHKGSYVILQPLRKNCPVLLTRKYPNKRVKITPQPTIQFIHPLCGLAVQNKIDDISPSGFSITVQGKESLLIPGMIIPRITIQLPGMIGSLPCAAQVIYRREQTRDLARYGFYILDISLNDQRRLFDAVSKADDPHVNIAGTVNMDSLWELFFGSGFIYPDKYGIISHHAAKLKETYRKLYEEGEDIFTHLTYQDQGHVYAHMSMVKTYEDSWIIHHMAAIPMRGVRTGLKILNHFISYMDCLYRLPVKSKSMRYNFCYYRPENKFSDYYFGGVYQTFNDRNVCSMDLFGYMTMSVELEMKTLPVGWKIDVFSYDDLMLMKACYHAYGGGMMLDALALEYRAAEYDGSAQNSDGFVAHRDNNIMSLYHKIGLKRDVRVFSVKYNGQMKAALIVDVSDMGVNMSELLNSIKIIVVDHTLPWPVLQDAVSNVGKVYQADKIWVLIYPFDYLGAKGVDCKKRYNFWVLNTNIDGSRMDIIKNHAKIVKRRFVTEKLIREIALRRRKKFMEKLEKQA